MSGHLNNENAKRRQREDKIKIRLQGRESNRLQMYGSSVDGEKMLGTDPKISCGCFVILTPKRWNKGAFQFSFAARI